MILTIVRKGNRIVGARRGRISTLLESTESVSPNEVITLTTDYEDRSLSNRMLSVQTVTNDDRNNEYSRHTDSPPPALFFDEDTNTRNQYYSWILSCCYENEQTVYDVNRRAPPSYSTIFPFYRDFDTYENNNDSGHMAVLINNCSSFIAPIPPPSYAQDQGIYVAESLEPLISNNANNGVIWSPSSTTAICPRCATLVITVVETQQATTTHFMAIALFLLGCWPCCILPYCIDSCKTSHHYCPFCRTYLGTYTP